MENSEPRNNLAETLAKELKKPFEIAGDELSHVRRVALPPGWTLKEIDDEKLLPKPRRKVSSVRLDNANSFIAYVSLHSTLESTILFKASYTAGKVEFLAIAGRRRYAAHGN